MSKKRSKKTNTEDFQTGYTKAEWFGSSRRGRNKKRPAKNKIYKKISPNLDAVEVDASYTQLVETSEIRPVSEPLPAATDVKPTKQPQ